MPASATASFSWKPNQAHIETLRKVDEIGVLHFYSKLARTYDREVDDEGLRINQLVYRGYLDLQVINFGIRVTMRDKGRALLSEIDSKARQEARRATILNRCGRRWGRTKKRLRDDRKRVWDARYDNSTLF